MRDMPRFSDIEKMQQRAHIMAMMKSGKRLEVHECVAECCSVLQSVAAYCSVLQCLTVPILWPC